LHEAIDGSAGASWKGDLLVTEATAVLLFGESAGCLLVEVHAGKESDFAARFGPGLAHRLGEVLDAPMLVVHALGDALGDAFGGEGTRTLVDPLLSVSIEEMLGAWKGAAKEVLP